MLRVRNFVWVGGLLGSLLHAVWLLALIVCFSAISAKGIAATLEYVEHDSFVGGHMEEAMQDAFFSESVLRTEGQGLGGDSSDFGSLFLPLEGQIVIAQGNEQITTISIVRSPTRRGSRITSYFFSNPNTANAGTSVSSDFETVLSVRFSRLPTSFWSSSLPPLNVSPTFGYDEGLNPIFDSYGTFYQFIRRNLDTGERVGQFLGRALCILGCGVAELVSPGEKATEYTLAYVDALARSRLTATYAPTARSDILGVYDPVVEISAYYGDPASMPLSRAALPSPFPTTMTVPTPYSSIRIGGVPIPKERITVTNFAGVSVEPQNYTSNSLAEVAPRLNYAVDYHTGGSEELARLWSFINIQTATTAGLARVNLTSTVSAVFVDTTRQQIQTSATSLYLSMCRFLPCTVRRVVGFDEGRVLRDSQVYGIEALPSITGSVTAQFEGVIAHQTTSLTVEADNQTTSSTIVGEDVFPISVITILDHSPLLPNNNNFVRSLFGLPIVGGFDAQIIQEPTDSSRPSFVEPGSASPHVLIPISNVPAYSSGRDLDYTFYASHAGALGINTVFTEAVPDGLGGFSYRYATDLSPCIPEQIEYEDGTTATGVVVGGDVATLVQLQVREGYNTVTFFDLKPGEYTDCMLQLIPDASVGTQVGFNLHVAPFVVNPFRRNFGAPDSDGSSYAYLRSLWDPFFATDVSDQALLATLALSPSDSRGLPVTTETILSVYSPSVTAVGEGNAEQVGYLSRAAPTLSILVDTVGLGNSTGSSLDLMFDTGDVTTINVVVPIQGQISGSDNRDIPIRVGDFRATVSSDEVTNDVEDAQIIIQKDFSELLEEDLLARQLVISTGTLPSLGLNAQSGVIPGEDGSLVFRTVSDDIAVDYILTTEVVVVRTVSSDTENTILSTTEIPVLFGTTSTVNVGEPVQVSVVTLGRITTTVSVYVTTSVEVVLAQTTGTQAVGISTVTVVTLVDVLGTIDWHPTVATTYEGYVADYEAAYLAGIIHFESFLFRGSFEFGYPGPTHRPAVYEFDNVTEGAEIEILMPLSLSLTSDGGELVVKNHAEGQSIDVAYYRGFDCSDQGFEDVVSIANSQSPSQVITNIVNTGGFLVESIPLTSGAFVIAPGNTCVAARYNRNGDTYFSSLISNVASVVLECLPLDMEYTGVGQSPFSADGSSVAITFVTTDGATTTTFDATVADFGGGSSIAATDTGTYTATINELDFATGEERSVVFPVVCDWSITPRTVQVTGLVLAASATTYGVTEVGNPFTYDESVFVGSSCSGTFDTDTLSSCLDEEGVVTTSLQDVGSTFTWTVGTTPTFNGSNYTLFIPSTALEALVSFQLSGLLAPALPTTLVYGSAVEDIIAAIEVTGLLGGQGNEVIDFNFSTVPQYVSPGVASATQVGSTLELSVNPSAINYAIPKAVGDLTLVAAPLTFVVRGVEDAITLIPNTSGLDNLDLDIQGFVAGEENYVVVSSPSVLKRSYGTSSNYPVAIISSAAVVVTGTALFTLGDYDDFFFILSGQPNIVVRTISTSELAEDFAVSVAREQLIQVDSSYASATLNIVATSLRATEAGDSRSTNVNFGNSSCDLLRTNGGSLPQFGTLCPAAVTDARYEPEGTSDVFHIGITVQNETFGYVVVILADQDTRSAVSVPDSELVAAERFIGVNVAGLGSDNYGILTDGAGIIQSYLNPASVFNPQDLLPAAVMYGDQLSDRLRQMRVNTNYCLASKRTSTNATLDCSTLQTQLRVSVSSSTLLDIPGLMSAGLTRRIPSTYEAVLPAGAVPTAENTYDVPYLRPSTQNVFVVYTVELPEHVPPYSTKSVSTQIHVAIKDFVITNREVRADLVGKTLLYNGAVQEVVTGTLVRAATSATPGIFADDDVRLTLAGVSTVSPIYLTFSGTSETMSLEGLDAANYVLSSESSPATVVGSIREEVQVQVPIVHMYGTTNPVIDADNIIVSTVNTILSDVVGLRSFIKQQAKVTLIPSGSASFCDIEVGSSNNYVLSLATTAFNGTFVRITSSNFVVIRSPANVIPMNVSLFYGQSLGVVNASYFDNYTLAVNSIDSACNAEVFGNNSPGNTRRKTVVFGKDIGNHPLISAGKYVARASEICTPVSDSPLATVLQLSQVTHNSNFYVVNTGSATLTINRLPVEASASLTLPYGHDFGISTSVIDGQISIPFMPRTCSSNTFVQFTNAGTSSPRIDVTNVSGVAGVGKLVSRCLGGDDVYFDAGEGVEITAASYTTGASVGSSFNFSIASTKSLVTTSNISIDNFLLPLISTSAGGTIQVVSRGLVVQPDNVALNNGQTSLSTTLNTVILEGCMANGQTLSSIAVENIGGLVLEIAPEISELAPVSFGSVYVLTYSQNSIGALAAPNYTFLMGSGIGSSGIGVRLNVLLEGAVKLR